MDLGDAALEARRQFRLMLDRVLLPSESSLRIDRDALMSIEPVTPPPSVNQDASPPRYSGRGLNMTEP
jgi:hypothetical protein